MHEPIVFELVAFLVFVILKVTVPLVARSHTVKFYVVKLFVNVKQNTFHAYCCSNGGVHVFTLY